MSSPLCFLRLPEYPACPVLDPLMMSPDTEGPDSVLDLSVKKRPAVDSAEDVPSPKRRPDSGDEYWSQEEEYHNDSLRQEMAGMGTYKKYLLKRYCKFESLFFNFERG